MSNNPRPERKKKDRKLPPAKNLGDVAQLGERLVCNHEVVGSIPIVSIDRLGTPAMQRESQALLTR